MYTMLIDKIYYLRQNIMLSKDLLRDEDVSLPELKKKVGKAWVETLMMMPGPCTDGEGLSTTDMTLSSLSLANMGIQSLASL